MVGTFRQALRRRLPAAIVGTAWLLVVLGGLKFLLDLQSGAGRAASPPAAWPASSRLSRDLERPTLVLIAHPRCPCTRATMAELERVMARSSGRVRCWVLFSIPPGRELRWAESDLWHTAARIPGVRRFADAGSREAHRFGAFTSGQTLLYDREGQLRFAGGITPGRGHAGDNAGADAVLALVLADGPGDRSPGTRAVAARAADLPSPGPLAGVQSTPVFGCALTCPHDSLSPGGDPCRK